MDKCFLDVLDFHKSMAQDKIGSLPGIPTPEIAGLRWDLVSEEYEELREAWNSDDVIKLSDSIIDLIYVLVGMAISYGVDLRPLWDEVHRANMAKADGPVREDGKRLKGPNWRAPNIKGLLEKQEPIS